MASSAFVPSAPIEGLPAGEPPLPLEGGWTNAQAKKIVKSDFQMAETFRQQNIEPRWIQADRTYLAWNGGTRTWEGTRIPRANMSVYLAYQNIEVLMTQVIDAIFGQDLSFDVQPGSATTSVAQAQMVRSLLMDQFNRLNCGSPNFISLREIYQRMKKEAFIYGNGVCEFGWEDANKTRDVYSRGPIQPFVDAVYNGMTVRVPAVGPMNQGVYSESEKYTESKPFLIHRSIKDFYIDPNTPSPSVQEARYCATRTLMTVAQLQGYRDKEGFTIPSDARLFELSKKVIVSSSDMLKQVQDSYRGYNSQPTLNQSVDPRLAQVEVIRYWQKEQHVWLLGREDVALNRPNPYGVLPFLGTYYTSVPNRFYALSVCDLVEGDQNLACELINGRLDELNLILHPPIIRKRGSFLAASAAKFRPGGSFEVDQPKEDLVRMEMGNVTQEAFIEVDQVERRTAKTIGVADTTGFGVSSAGGNSALRSATGVQTQANAQSARVHYQVANDEDQFFLPLLNIFWGLNKLHLDPQQMIQLTGMAEPIDPVEVLNADPRFTMETASKMKGRAALQGGGLQVFMQGMLNPQVVEMASQQGLKPNFEAITATWCDAYNQKYQAYWEQLTPEDMQRKQAEIMAPLQAKSQLQQDRLNAMSADAESRDETDIIVKVLDVLQKSGAINNLVDVKRDVEIMAQQKKLSNGQ